MITVDAPRPIEIPESGMKAVQVSGDVATVVNALEAAKETEDLRSDKEALVEIAEAYTGWSP